MGHPLIARRAVLAALAIGGGVLGRAPELRALGRTPVGGKLALVLPWALGRVDPLDLFDPAGALFGHSLFDPLFALDAAAAP